MLARHARAPGVDEVTPALRAKLGDAVGRWLLLLITVIGTALALVGLGVGVGLFWRAVRWINGW